MLVTLVKEANSSFAGVMDDASIRQEEDELTRAGFPSTGFSVELPYTPQGATLLAPVLLSWRKARAGRTVTLTLGDGSTLEIGGLSAAEIEWKLPIVTLVAIVEMPQS